MDVPRRGDALTPPRYFVLTGGEDVDAAIAFVEERHGDMVSAAFHRCPSIPVVGIVEIVHPGPPDGSDLGARS
jgi:hypothetical protein